MTKIQSRDHEQAAHAVYENRLTVTGGLRAKNILAHKKTPAEKIIEALVEAGLPPEHKDHITEVHIRADEFTTVKVYRQPQWHEHD